MGLVFRAFFFFKQKTAYEMRISDWSSDVCSSDLDDLFDDRGIRRHARGDLRRAVFLEEAGGEAEQVALHRLADVGDGALAEPAHEIEAQRGGEGEGEDDDIEKAEMRRDKIGRAHV